MTTLNTNSRIRTETSEMTLQPQPDVVSLATGSKPMKQKVHVQADPIQTKSDPPHVDTPGRLQSSDWFNWVVGAEFLIAFTIGIAIMSFVYVDQRGVPYENIGAPGHDSFYHVKMAAMIPETGLVDEFPWLQEVYFSKTDNRFVSHHYGFHILLAPFVAISHWITGDYLPGGRWAIATFFGLCLGLMQLLLASERVRWRWLWLIVFLALPSQFFLRHSYIRAICPSLVFMLLIVFLMFRERYVWAGVAVALYTHLYLGAVVYSPVIVGLYVASHLIGPGGERSVPWRLAMWTTLGWLIGLRTYPYYDGALEFLWMQIFGTGLNPDIAVGGEWNSYGNVWEFAVQMSGPILAVWAMSLVLRTRIGKALSPKETLLLLLNFAFLFLTFKAQRFIEYWPIFCLLSAALMARPVVNSIAERFDPLALLSGKPIHFVMSWVSMVVISAAAIGSTLMPSVDIASAFLTEWKLWTMLGMAGVAVALVRIWFGEQHEGRSAGTLASATPIVLMTIAFGAGLSTFLQHQLGASTAGEAKLYVGWLAWGALAAFVLCVVVVASRRTGVAKNLLIGRRLAASVSAASLGFAVVAGVILVGANRLSAVQGSVYCGYDLPAMREALGYLESVSEQGDIVFTDDWDVFPVYFYHNSYNRYLVGLDPKFTHSRKPELWERYIKITRGLTPRTFTAGWTGDDGKRVEREIRVLLEDIRDHFKAKYVITDRDHKSLAKNLAKATDFAELIFPMRQYEKCREEPYLVFRILDVEEATSTTMGADNTAMGSDNIVGSESVVLLSSLTPEQVEQGWGKLSLDKSVSGRPLKLGSRYFEYGLGTHANSEIVYRIPPGCTTFRARAGVNAFADSVASVVLSVRLDGREVFRSRLLTSDSPVVDVSVPLESATIISLVAECTEDGNRWDHVDWALARLVKGSS